jgi:SAM-dependent methyltransferase
MVAMAERRNCVLVDGGLADLRQADSLHLPFEDATFDKVFSVHTVYFWATPVAQMREARRVLKDGGRFVLGFRPESEQARRDFPASVYTFRLPQQIRQMLLSAGFQSVSLVDRGAAVRGIILAVASAGGAPAISEPASNAWQHETSP